jgi:hypothetical protein
MPFVATLRTAATEFVRVRLPKLQTPLPHGFIGDGDPSLCQQFFNIAITEGETEIQPHGVANNLSWKAKAFVIRSSGRCFHEAILSHCSAKAST